MAHESRSRRDQRKKPQMTLKERRAKKHEKKFHKDEHIIQPNSDYHDNLLS